MTDETGAESFGVGHIEPDIHSDDSAFEDVCASPAAARTSLHCALARIASAD